MNPKTIIPTFLLGISCHIYSQPAPILIQGAMDIEVNTLRQNITNPIKKTYSNWTFWSGTIDGYPVVISKTGIGMVNAAAATLMGVVHFHPCIIINQGVAGAVAPRLHRSDLVIGTGSINIGQLKTPYRAYGQGSKALSWQLYDPAGSTGKSGYTIYHSDKNLFTWLYLPARHYHQGYVVSGITGSSDQWNKEVDYLNNLHKKYKVISEDMETAASAQVAKKFSIPFASVRAISDSAANNQPYLRSIAKNSQHYVINAIHPIIKSYRLLNYQS